MLCTLITNQWIGLCKVIKVVGRHGYKLNIPRGTRIHNVIHTTLLKPSITREDPQMESYEDEEKDMVYGDDHIVDSRRKIQDVGKAKSNIMLGRISRAG